MVGPMYFSGDVGISGTRSLRGRGGYSPLQDTWDITGYGQQAGGTHPTGMLSCLKIKNKTYKFSLCRLI